MYKIKSMLLKLILISILSGCQNISDNNVETNNNKDTSVIEQENNETKKQTDNWQLYENEKIKISFLYPEALKERGGDSVSIYIYVPSKSKDRYLSIRNGKSTSIADMGNFSFPDSFREKLRKEVNCKNLIQEGPFSAPINFQRPYLCDIFKNNEKGIAILYALGIGSVYGEKPIGMIYIATESRAILLEGNAFVLDFNNKFASKKVQSIYEKNEPITLDTYLQFPPSDQEISNLLTDDNLDFLKKIAESINIESIEKELHVYNDKKIAEEILLYESSKTTKLPPLSKGEYYKKYTNSSLGISFVYKGHLKSYIEDLDGKLENIIYDEKNNTYYKNPQDNISIYDKIPQNTIEETVKKRILQQVSSLEKCNFVTTEEKEEKEEKKVFVKYQEDYIFNENNCLDEEEKDNAQDCHYRQYSEYNKNAAENCSKFEKSPFGNYFLYQPENTKNKTAFVAHVSGLDAAPWSIDSIKLFDIKEKENTEQSFDIEENGEFETQESTTNLEIPEQQKGLEIVDNMIYLYNTKRGWIKDNRIFIEFEDSIYSFEFAEDFENLYFNPIQGYEHIIEYKGVSIILPTEKHKIQIVYKCSGPLLHNQPYEYCETNEIDFLTQYEFGQAFGQFTSGANTTFHWNKIAIIKKLNDNVIFNSSLLGDIYDPTDQPVPSEIERIKSKEYLDLILQNKKNIEKQQQFKKIVDSFKLEN